MLTISGCKAPLGMEKGLISDAQISASSEWDNNHGAERARLNGRSINLKKGAWSPSFSTLGQWLQVDLEKYTTVTGLATQGRSDYNQWVTKYRVQYSDDGVSFHLYTEPGDGSQKVQSKSEVNKINKFYFSGRTSTKYWLLRIEVKKKKNSLQEQEALNKHKPTRGASSWTCW